jgi:hypothetical protein
LAALGVRPKAVLLMKTEAQVVIEAESNTIFGPNVVKNFVGKSCMGWDVIDAIQTTPRTILLTISGELKVVTDNEFFKSNLIQNI